MRTLTIIPIIHTPEEFGSLKQQVVSTHEQAFGKTFANELFADVRSYWEEVQRRIVCAGYGHPSLAEKLHIFIDSLPNSDNRAIVERVIHELHEKKIPFYSIAVMLQECGARIHGTEDIAALMNEYHYWQSIVRGQPADQAKEAHILEGRDRAIAKRINAIVPQKEHALLFIDRFHDVASKIRTPRKKWILITL